LETQRRFVPWLALPLHPLGEEELARGSERRIQDVSRREIQARLIFSNVFSTFISEKYA
jgi:hypothetical protein